jgi:hypothetical protein
VTSLKTAIEIYYRWRVSQYFNDIMAVSGGQGISPSYVFPYPDFNLLSYNGSVWTTPGPGIDLTVTGPGILGVMPIGGPIGATAVTLTNITAVYPDPAGSPAVTVVFPSVTLKANTLEGVATPVGGQVLTADSTTGGVVTVASNLGFKQGYPVVIAQNTPGVPGGPGVGALPVLKYEVAEVALPPTTTTLTLRPVTPPGGTAAANGLRNQYTGNVTDPTNPAVIYPLFKNVQAPAPSGAGTEHLQIGFYPDYPQGFVDMQSVVVSQVAGQSLLAVDQAAAEGDDLSPASSPPPVSTRPSHAPPSARSSPSQPGKSAEKF